MIPAESVHKKAASSPLTQSSAPTCPRSLMPNASVVRLPDPVSEGPRLPMSCVPSRRVHEGMHLLTSVEVEAHDLASKRH